MCSIVCFCDKFDAIIVGRVVLVDWDCGSLGGSLIHLVTLLRRLGIQTNLYCADSGSKRISTAQTRAPPRDTTAQTRAPPRDTTAQTRAPPRDTTAQTRAPPRDTTAQTRAPNESLLRRLGLQTNLYCADSGSTS